MNRFQPDPATATTHPLAERFNRVLDAPERPPNTESNHHPRLQEGWDRFRRDPAAYETFKKVIKLYNDTLSSRSSQSVPQREERADLNWKELFTQPSEVVVENPSVFFEAVTAPVIFANEAMDDIKVCRRHWLIDYLRKQSQPTPNISSTPR